MSKYTTIFFILLSFFCLTSKVGAQTTTITGVVTDSITEAPLSFISVFLGGTTTGVMTDDNGRYTIRTSNTNFSEIGASSLGYREKRIPIKPGGTHVINIALRPSDYILKDVNIRPKKEKYSRKNNPAVEFVKKLIERRDENNP